ncbi:unnamed protein product [Miscanthus lutarioriparius]|uniref:Uncharacterized protein n=1 Tax=Miscanthus lutarioriparius TaxID=422564 RepID=A0A811NCV8_9POAL|nr:unnamed protein product [Miscanthus lutarioriparius]
MKLVWCPDTASKAYIDGVRAIANDASADGSPELAELVAAMAGGWNAQLIVDAPYVDVDASPPPSSSRRPPATSLALAAAARRTGGRYARLDNDNDNDGATTQEAINSSSAAEAAMARLEGVDLLVLDARRRDAAAVLRAARPGPRGMVVVRHGDTTGGGVRRRAAASATASATAPWGTMAAGTRVVRAAYLPIGAGGVEVLHVGVGKGPSLPTAQQQSRRSGRGRWIRHVNHRTGEEHVFRRQ